MGAVVASTAGEVASATGSAVSPPQATTPKANRLTKTSVAIIRIFPLLSWKEYRPCCLTLPKAHFLVDFLYGADGDGAGSVSAVFKNLADVSGSGL